jgi:DnaJ-domain-containing protein 1
MTAMRFFRRRRRSARPAGGGDGEPARRRRDRRSVADDVDLDGDPHAWWAQREQLDQGVPRGRRRRRDAEPKPDIDDPWSIDKLFEFVPEYELDLDAQPEPEPLAFAHERDPEDLFLGPGTAAEQLLRVDDPYAVLGVTATATWEEITEAHRKLARLHHPDRLVTASADTRAASEERMRDVNIAYAELRRRRGK